MSACTPWEYDVLQHASTNGRYVTAEAAVITLAERGWLRDYGAQALAGGAHYLTVTPLGREIIVAYRATLPPPPLVKKRRRSEVFDRWLTYCGINGRVPFREFLKDIWPRWRQRL